MPGQATWCIHGSPTLPIQAMSCGVIPLDKSRITGVFGFHGCINHRLISYTTELYRPALFVSHRAPLYHSADRVIIIFLFPRVLSPSGWRIRLVDIWDVTHQDDPQHSPADSNFSIMGGGLSPQGSSYRTFWGDSQLRDWVFFLGIDTNVLSCLSVPAFR